MDESLSSLTKLGFRLLPLLPRQKIPSIKAWQEKASSDEAVIGRWTESFPDRNWGLATGEGSGVFVVDIDPKNGGMESWKNLVNDQKLPRTATCITGSGGYHYYFKYPQVSGEVRSSSSVGGFSGVDIRGNNGQVVVPPSLHPNGNYYRWEIPPWEIVADAPKWLLKIVVSDQKDHDYNNLAEPLEVGTRNDTIYHNAIKMARADVPVEMALQTILTAVHNDPNGKDLQDDEVRTTVKSAYNRSVANKKASKAIENFEASDSGNAKRIIEEHGKNLIYVYGLGWHVWQGKYWRPDQLDLTVKRLCADSMLALRDEAIERSKECDDAKELKQVGAVIRWALLSRNAGKLSAMIDLSRTFDMVQKQVEDLDGPATGFLLNCKNGLLDLRTGILQPHNKEMLITRYTNHNYNPEAECPTWLQTLHFAFDGNQSLINYMQRALGYSLSASVSEQCIFICWGESGNNGKSTILEGLQKILGHGYAQMSDMRVITAKDKDNQVSSSLAKLVGVRMVSMNEGEEDQKLSEALVKQMTGGDTLQARKLYFEVFEYTPTFKLWIRTNARPAIYGINDAIWRRIKLIPFNKQIPVEERRRRDDVDREIYAEAEGILAWAVRGFQEWYKNGLQDPEEVCTAVRNYRAESDILSLFFDECVEESSTSHIGRQQMYQTFVVWARENGYRFTMTSDKFGKRVAIRLDQKTREKYGGKPIWRGIKLSDYANTNYAI